MKPSRVEVAFSTPWFEIVAKHHDGEDAPHYALRTDDYVSVLARTAAGTYLLVRQYRPAVEQVTLELPAGHVERGESPAAAALRELEEETGYRGASTELIAELLPDTGRLANRMWCVLVNGATRVGPATEAGIELVECTGAELAEHVRARRLNNALQLGLLFVAQLDGKLELEAP